MLIWSFIDTWTWTLHPTNDTVQSGRPRYISTLLQAASTDWFHSVEVLYFGAWCGKPQSPECVFPCKCATNEEALLIKESYVVLMTKTKRSGSLQGGHLDCSQVFFWIYEDLILSIITCIRWKVLLPYIRKKDKTQSPTSLMLILCSAWKSTSKNQWLRYLYRG